MTSGCGTAGGITGPKDKDIEGRLATARASHVPLYYAGDLVAGLPLTDVELYGRGNALFVYGTCKIPASQTDGGCAPPIEIQMFAANPGPTVHVALLGMIVAIGLVVFTVSRRRRRRDAAMSEPEPTSHSVEKPPVNQVTAADPLEAWIAELAGALDVDPSAIDRDLVLDLSRATHRVARAAAPFTILLVGIAAGRSGGGAEAVRGAATMAQRLAVNRPRDLGATHG